MIIIWKKFKVKYLIFYKKIGQQKFIIIKLFFKNIFFSADVCFMSYLVYLIMKITFLKEFFYSCKFIFKKIFVKRILYSLDIIIHILFFTYYILFTLKKIPPTLNIDVRDFFRKSKQPIKIQHISENNEFYIRHSDHIIDSTSTHQLVKNKFLNEFSYKKHFH